jgi:hypothetical protein
MRKMNANDNSIGLSKEVRRGELLVFRKVNNYDKCTDIQYGEGYGSVGASQRMHHIHL